MQSPKPYSSLADSVIEAYNKSRINGPHPILCYAPFKNMYFGHYGKVTACCCNRAYLLGTFPNEGLKEIWFGAKSEKLREYIRHNDLSLGCESCTAHFRSQNFEAIKAKQYDTHQSNSNLYPSVIEFELDNVCNLECRMCDGNFSSSIRKNREKRPPYISPYNSDFVKQLEGFIPFLDEAKFYGGEPFLIDIYYEIWDKIVEIKPEIRITVQTNGTILNNRVKRLLDKANFHIGISVDSLEKETYEKIRKNAKYETVMSNLEYFHAYSREKNTFFGLSICAIRDNWHELPAYFRFCNEKEIPVYINTVWHPVISAIWSYPSSKLKEIWDHLSEYDLPEKTSLQRKNKQHYRDLVGQIKNWYEEAVIREKGDVHIQNLPIGSRERIHGMIKLHFFSNEQIPESKKQAEMEWSLKKIDQIFDGLPPEYELKLLFIMLAHQKVEELIFRMKISPVAEIQQIIINDWPNIERIAASYQQ